MTAHEKARTRAYVIHPQVRENPKTLSDDRTDEAKLDEANGLALAIDLDVLGAQIIKLKKPTPATLLGSGIVDELGGLFKQLDIQLVVMDGAITPIQQRNLEKAWGCKVIDRTGLILEIFGQRARTAEGSLQVELAALSYQRSRLVRSWTHLERQRGGFGFTGGPGETQKELDRRLIDTRIIKIKAELAHTQKTRSLHRRARQRVPYPVIALVGYTNAGKSTLFNYLTKAKVLAEDLLFATLDPTMRVIKLPSGREVILSDTVGFISNLPTTLVAAFRATLEEVTSADLIVHVRDASHQDAQFQAQDVEKVLNELGLQKKVESGELIDVYNKVDVLSPEDVASIANRAARDFSAVAISALTGHNVDQLLQLIDRRLNEQRKELHVTIKAHQGELLAWCYRRGAIAQRHDRDDIIELVLMLAPEDVDRFWELCHENR